MKAITISMGTVRALIDAAERRGIDRQALLAALRDLRASESQTAGGEAAARGFTGSARTAMIALLQNGGASIEAVARALAVSPRTLQRRLESEGTTYGALHDETRRSVALECLGNPRIAIKEAAYRVGFSEPSTFYRAFRRWTGATPANYRRALAL